MKLSSETIAILKNFATINQSIVIRPGSRITTKVPQSDSIIAGATVIEDFPKEFGIYDLNEFLSILSMFTEPNIDFSGEYKVNINEGKTNVGYAFYNPSMLTAAPPTGLKAVDPVCMFELQATVYQKLLKATSIMSLPQIVIKGDGERILLCASNSALNDSNTYNVEMGETDVEFQAYVDVEWLKMIQGTYNVSVNPRNLRFDAVDKQLTYWVALRKNSKF